MKKLFLIVFAFFTLWVKADEGMWIPMFIERNFQDMQKLGLKLTAEEIYSINNSSLKDAVVVFGSGCTGEIISPQGLLITNHHCGYGQIQSHSSIEHDYLTDGFWAMSLEEELPNPGLAVKFLVRIEDVTEVMNGALTGDMTEDQRNARIMEVSKELTGKATKDTYYDASVRSFFGGNEFYLFVYATYKDVRLVGTPPNSIGKFGGDTDNWMWPRHTGDFSLFRVYMAPDGSPAEYSSDNVPYQPKHYLPVSTQGYAKGDFALVMGYPGSTERYLTSWGVKQALETYNPSVVKIRQEKLDIIGADMDACDKVRIQYATKYARISNYWKYYIGQTRGLKRLKVYEKKVELESRFRGWVSMDKNRSAYTTVLNDIQAAYHNMSNYTLSNVYYREAGLRGAEITGFAYRFKPLLDELKAEKPDQAKIDKIITGLKETSANYFKDYNEPTDMAILAAMMDLFFTDVPSDKQPAYLGEMHKKFKGCWDTYAEEVFSKSVFACPDKVKALLEDPTAKAIEKDMAFLAYMAFYDRYTALQKEQADAQERLARGNRMLIAGLREMYPDRNLYPDANFTMRLTYGSIQDYYPADGVFYDYFTTLDGIMEKEDPANDDFIVPEKLKELYAAKDFGPYAQDGVLHTCFLTNHDITGGNSGSPVMNGKGELIGLAFDGNWEAMSGDIAYEPNLQRTICVDIRYVLFVIDKYAGAQNLIKEMTLR
jgi:hypothetical protein